MNYFIEFDPGTETIVVALSGDFDLELCRRAMNEVHAIRSSVPRAHSVWDVSALVFSTLDVESVKRTASVRDSVAQRRADERMATVLSDPTDRTIIHLLFAHSQVPAPNWRFFDTLDDAIAWCAAAAEESD